ncbi:MAG: FecR domain-containing protein [Phycisphaerales bacterium]
MAKLNRFVLGGTLVIIGAGAAQAGEVRRTAPAALFAAAGAARAVQAPGQPEAAPELPQAGKTPAVIVAFEGKVQYRLGADKEWQNATVGALLSEGAELNTGLRSAVQVKIGVGQVLTIDRISRVLLREAVARAGTEKTTVELPYGRVKFDVASATVANDVQIQAPDATLAVKGTTGLMEVTAGQPTMAMGGAENTGTIAVAYDASGTTSEITSDEASDADNPDPAQSELTSTQLDTSDTSARSGDESQQVANSPGGGQSVRLATSGGTQVARAAPPLNQGPRDLTFIFDNPSDEELQLVRRPALGGERIVLRSGSLFDGSFNFNDGGASLALGSNASGTGIEVFRLESFSGGWRLLGLDLTQMDSVFQVRASDPGASNPVFGLATIGNRFFASTFNSQAGLQSHTIVEMMLGSPTLTPRMLLPFDSVGSDAGGITERGTMVLFGAQGSSSEFIGGSIFEVDPRSNYVLRASGPLVTGSTTMFEDGTTASSLLGGQVIGLSVASGLVFAQVETEFGMFLVTINATAAGTTLNPTIVRVQAFGGRLPGLASETRGNAPGPLNLPMGSGTVDPGLPTLFAAMGFGPLAVTSESFRLMVAGQVIASSVDPVACASTNILFTGLQNFLAGRINVQNGVGLAVNDFRLMLPLGHPCLRPGQLGALPPIIGIDSSGNLFARNELDSVDSPLAGPFSFNDVTGAAVRSVAANGTREFLVLDIDSSGGTFTLQSLSLMNPMAGFTAVDSGMLNGIDLFGLGTIGTRIFAGGLPGVLDDTFTIYELGVSPGTLTPRLQLPFNAIDGALGGSNTRGSIFVTGDSGDFSMIPGITASVFEIDPRNSYVRRIANISFGASTIAPGIDVMALSQHDITVTGSTFVNGRLVLSIQDENNGMRYFVFINPDAAGTTNDPTVVRITQSVRDVLGLGSETLVAPPAPLNLASPTSTIDMTLGFAANVAYSAQAAGRSELGDLFRTAIVNSSVDPVNCLLAPELTSAPNFLLGHVNQQFGFGQSANDFRLSLSFGHPCGTGMVTNFDNLLLYFDPMAMQLIARNDLGAEITVLSNPAGLNFGATFDGVARRDDGSAQGQLLRLEATGSSGNSWSLLGLNLNNPASGFTQLASSSGPVPLFHGLATLGSRIFGNAMTVGGGTFMEFHEFTIGSSMTDVRGALAVSQPQGGLAGARERGSVFFVAQVPGLSGTNLTDLQVFEYDPRTNHLIGVTDISVDASTVITGTFDVNNNPQVLGVAYLGNRVIMSVVDGAGQRAFIVYNPGATGGPGDPTVLQITQTARFPGEIGSETRGMPLAPAFVSGPTTEPDLRTRPEFAGLSFSSSALGAATAMVIDHILSTSQSPTVCAMSPEFANIPGAVSAHTNQMFGVGQALGDFRFGLPFDHPCQVSEANIGFFFIDESAAQLRTASIDTTTFSTDPRTLTISPRTGPTQAGGLAIAGTPLGSRTLYRLESDIVGGGSDFSEIFALDLRDPQSDFVSVAQFSNLGLTGIGAVGTSLFAVGRPDASVAPGIYSINVPLTLAVQIIDVPFLGNASGRTAMGSSNERGTVFVNALVPEAMGGPAHVAILEFDPRNNYFVDAYTSDPSTGPIFVDTGTQNNAAGFTSFDQVTRVDGISYNQGLLTVNGTYEVTPGTPVPLQFQVNTFAAQSGGPNAVRRIDGLPSNRFGTVAHLPVNPPAPTSLTNPGGAIDMRGLTTLFADLAFSQRAFDTGVVTRMAESAVVASASNPIGCATSMELQTQLGPALMSRINQRAGMGRGITDFRNALPINHPCRPN